MDGSLVDEVADVRLGDKRLTKRLAIIVDRLGANPNMSISAAMRGRNETEAAYEFFSHEAVTPNAILNTHFAMTRKRVSQEKVCLLVQDTTEIELTRPSQQVKGAGPMSSEAQFGTFLHPLIAYTTAGIPLGVAWQKNWVRTAIKTDMTPAEKKKERNATPIEDKESIRWIEGHREALKIADESAETRCILRGDSESDIYELFSEPRETSH